MSLNINASGAAPVIDLPFLYVNGLQVAYGSTTTVTIQDGQCRDSTNTYDMTLSSPATLSTAANGFNGLDTGTIANSTMYALFLISDPISGNPTGLLLSLSSTAPTMPFGYSAFRLIDFVLTNGSAQILKFYNAGSGSTRYKEYDARISVLSAGAQTVYTALDLSVAVPLTNFGKVKLQASFTPFAATHTSNLQPTGATGDTITFIGQVSTVIVSDVVDILPLIASAKPEISYKVQFNTDALSLSVIGYDYYL